MPTAAEQELETQIHEKGANVAPRVLPQDVDDEIAHTQYHVFPGTTVTVAALTLKNGTVVTGESACACKENFNEEIGREIAYANAREKVWPLLGFLLREAISKSTRVAR